MAPKKHTASKGPRSRTKEDNEFSGELKDWAIQASKEYSEELIEKDKKATTEKKKNNNEEVSSEATNLTAGESSSQQESTPICYHPHVTALDHDKTGGRFGPVSRVELLRRERRLKQGFSIRAPEGQRDITEMDPVPPEVNGPALSGLATTSSSATKNLPPPAAPRAKGQPRRGRGRGPGRPRGSRLSRLSTSTVTPRSSTFAESSAESSTLGQGTESITLGNTSTESSTLGQGTESGTLGDTSAASTTVGNISAEGSTLGHGTESSCTLANISADSSTLANASVESSTVTNTNTEESSTLGLPSLAPSSRPLGISSTTTGSFRTLTAASTNNVDYDDDDGEYHPNPSHRRLTLTIPARPRAFSPTPTPSLTSSSAAEGSIIPPCPSLSPPSQKPTAAGRKTKTKPKPKDSQTFLNIPKARLGAFKRHSTARRDLWRQLENADRTHAEHGVIELNASLVARLTDDEVLALDGRVVRLVKDSDCWDYGVREGEEEFVGMERREITRGGRRAREETRSIVIELDSARGERAVVWAVEKEDEREGEGSRDEGQDRTLGDAVDGHGVVE